MKRFLAIALVAIGVATAATPVAAEYVCRLNPYGDNFLSLRTGPGSHYPEVDRLGPGTGLSVLRGSGPWLYVQTEDGARGWVFSQYVCN